MITLFEIPPYFSLGIFLALLPVFITISLYYLRGKQNGAAKH